MKSNNHPKIRVSFIRLITRLIWGNLLFLYKYGIIETTNRNLLTAIYILNPKKKQKYGRENLDMLNVLINYSIYINEFLDTKQFVKKVDDEKIKQEYKEHEKLIKSMEKELKLLKDNRIDTFLKEFDLFYKWADSKEIEDWNVKTIKENRDLMNAFHTFAVYAIATGLKDARLDKPAASIREMMNKYKWIVECDPQNQDEAAICVAWNLAMVGQILDDKYDKAIDEVCELATFATVLDRHYRKLFTKGKKLPQDIDVIVKNNVKAKLDEFKNEYYKKAKKLGYRPIVFQDIVLNSLYKVLKALMKYTSRLPRPLKTVLSKRIRFLRDRWRAMGKFD